MRAPTRQFRIVLRRRVGQLDEQHIIRRLIRLAIPFLPGVLGLWRLRQLLKHVLAALQNIARGSVLDGLERVDGGGAPVGHGQGIALDGLDRSPNGVGGVALGLGVVVFGVEGLLRGGGDVRSAIPRCTLQGPERVVAVSEASRLKTCVLSSVDCGFC